MKRKEWKFTYLGQDLVAGLSKRLDYHKSRRDFWRAEKDSAERSLKEKGADLREYPVTGGTQIHFVADPDLAARYSQCLNKLLFHESKIEEYQPWLLVMQANSSAKLELDHEDVLYFGKAYKEEEDN